MSVVDTLTDGTGVSAITASKFVKDFVADVLLSGAAALATAQIMDLGAAVAAPQVAGFAIAGAIIRAAYRAALRWATSSHEPGQDVRPAAEVPEVSVEALLRRAQGPGNPDRTRSSRPVGRLPQLPHGADQA